MNIVIVNIVNENDLNIIQHRQYVYLCVISTKTNQQQLYSSYYINPQTLSNEKHFYC